MSYSPIIFWGNFFFYIVLGSFCHCGVKSFVLERHRSWSRDPNQNVTFGLVACSSGGKMCQPPENQCEKMPGTWGRGDRKKRVTYVREKNSM